jgi:hypothetical protein
MNQNTLQPATPETVWAILQETIKMQKENEAKWEKSRIENEAKWEKSRIESEKRWKELSKQLGGMANSQGDFAEEYFFNSFENGKQNFFGEKFDEIDKNLKNHWQGLKDEYDIVLYNHAAVAIIEVKYKARAEDIPQVLKKAETFRILFPHYKDFKIYLGLASLSFESKLEQECINEGIAIIKQVGDTVVINDEHLKVF